MSGCNKSSSPSPSSQLNTITVSELERATGEYRGHYVSFSIKVDSAVITGDYRLALRATNETKPGATDIRNASATIVRTLSTTPVNVFMSFHMDTTLFDADWTVSPNVGVAAYLVSNTLAGSAVLQKDTAYVLYAVKEGETDNTVYRLKEFTTDNALPGTEAIYGLPSATHTIKNGEPFLLLAVIVNNGSNTDFRMNGIIDAVLSRNQGGIVHLELYGYSYSFITPPKASGEYEEYMVLKKSAVTGNPENKKAGDSFIINVVRGISASASSTFIVL